MKPLAIVVVLICVLWLSALGVHAAELWKCTTLDGQQVYTDNPPAYLKCDGYELKPILKSAPGQSGFKLEVPPGGITFETFRLLSTGMTEGEVLGQAGSPEHTYAITCDISVNIAVSCSKRWVYHYLTDNQWIVELTFVRGRVTAVDNFRIIR